MVLVFCDTDRKSFEQYIDIKRKINEFHGIDTAADNVVIYGNPCTMQIILEHWTDIRLKSSSKKNNAPLIKEFTGVDNYKGKANQREAIMKHITVENYQDMCARVSRMADKDTDIGSSNFDRLMKYLEGNNTGWIEEINDKLDINYL